MTYIFQMPIAYDCATLLKKVRGRRQANNAFSPFERPPCENLLARICYPASLNSSKSPAMPCKATILPVEIARDDTPREIWDWLLRKRKEVRDESESCPQSFNPWGAGVFESIGYETRMNRWEDQQEELEEARIELERRRLSQLETPETLSVP
ncbi:hypothetical protein TWF506_010772 [Arthrobotrys conoides]|uniref:Uncharacterized protein n=1 Tax=Arthrobotrys conoides TaxID=74498 RepID=A0AAN8NBI4_9PEZI